MRIATLLVCLMVLATGAYAEKINSDMPNNPPVTSDRQGGDTIASAVAIPALPIVLTGTTIGYTNDYDAVCYYTGSTSPDVVYSLVPCQDGLLTLSMCIAPTDYDTKIYVLDTAGTVIRCNDDWCSTPVSFVSFLGDENEGSDPLFGYVPVVGGNTYYVVVDGYGGSRGNYGLSITGRDCTTATESSSFSSAKSLYR